MKLCIVLFPDKYALLAVITLLLQIKKRVYNGFSGIPKRNNLAINAYSEAVKMESARNLQCAVEM